MYITINRKSITDTYIMIKEDNISIISINNILSLFKIKNHITVYIRYMFLSNIEIFKV